MQLEVGKYYRTRDGRKVGPMEKVNVRGWSGFSDEEYGHIFQKDGTHGDGDDHFSCIANECELDLIAEWTDEQPQTTQTILSGHTIDHIAIDSLRYHYATEMEPLQKEAFRIVLRYYGVSV